MRASNIEVVEGEMLPDKVVLLFAATSTKLLPPGFPSGSPFFRLPIHQNTVAFNFPLPTPNFLLPTSNIFLVHSGLCPTGHMMPYPPVSEVNLPSKGPSLSGFSINPAINKMMYVYVRSIGCTMSGVLTTSLR